MTKFQIFALSTPVIIALIMWAQGSLETYLHERERRRAQRIHAAE